MLTGTYCHCGTCPLVTAPADEAMNSRAGLPPSVVHSSVPSNRLAAAANVGGNMAAPLLPGWSQVVSRSSGQVYYANAALGVSRWERPSVPGYKRAIAASAPHPVSSSAAVAQSHFTSYERRQGHSNARSERGMRLRDERYRRALRESCAVLP